MAQATISCRFAAIHLEEPFLGYLRAKCRRFRRRLCSETRLRAQPLVTLFLPIGQVSCFSRQSQAGPNGAGLFCIPWGGKPLHWGGRLLR